MTSLLRPPAAFALGRARVPPPAWLTGAGAGLLAAAGGVVACMGVAVAGWLSGTSGSIGGAFRVGAGAWLLGHGYAVELGPATITLMPLGLTLLLAFALVGCTAGAARLCAASSSRALGEVAAASAAAYVGVVVLVAVLSAVSEMGLAHGRGVLVTVLMAATAAGAGAVRGGERSVQALLALPQAVVPVLRGALAGALALFGCAALVLAVSLVVHVEALQRIVGSLQPGPAGGLVLVAVCALVLPNAVLLATALVLGPGTAVGVGTSVTLTEVAVAPLPAIPWFAAVPAAGTQPVPLAALAALPVVAGVVAGVAAVRRLPSMGVGSAAGYGLLTGAMAGLLVGCWVAAAGGSIGPGRMADIGAPELLCLVVAVATLGIGGVLGGTSARLLGRGGS